MKLATLLPRDDEGYIRDRLGAFRDQGVTVLQVEPVGEDPLGDLRRLRTILDR